MNETEYIRVTNLAKIEGAISLLRDVLPDIDGVITKGDFGSVLSKLALWSIDLRNDIDLRDDVNLDEDEQTNL